MLWIASFPLFFSIGYTGSFIKGKEIKLSHTSLQQQHPKQHTIHDRQTSITPTVESLYNLVETWSDSLCTMVYFSPHEFSFICFLDLMTFPIKVPHLCMHKYICICIYVVCSKVGQLLAGLPQQFTKMLMTIDRSFLNNWLTGNRLTGLVS